MSEALTVPVTTTSRGAVRGAIEDGIAVFRGIPYAAAPVGPLRFAAPQPAPAWDDVRDATAYGPTPATSAYPPPFGTMLPEPEIPGDEILNLNVWTPAVPADADGDGLPVLVWIHGGAFRNGNGAIGTYDGGAFARDGVVCVTLNYRLGMDGFGALPDAPDNRGLLDQIAALEWVRDEIAAFGGDPGRVTMAGESAGAMSAVTHLAGRAGQGDGRLFRGVIAQSGAGHHVQPRASAERVAAELGRRLGVAPTAAGFASLDVQAFVDAQFALGNEVSTTDRATWGALGLDGMAFEPVIDGELVVERPIDALTAGAGGDVALLIGTNAQEYRFWLVPFGMMPHVTDEAIGQAAAVYGLSAEGVATYADAPTTADGLEALISDWFFRVPALRVAEARADAPASTHVYEFAWGSPLFDGELGAAHAVEIAFAFDRIRAESAQAMIGPDAPQALADEMHAAWVAFVRDGDPGWPAYDPQRRTTRVLGDDGAALVDDPRGARRAAWDGVR